MEASRSAQDYDDTTVSSTKTSELIPKETEPVILHSQAAATVAGFTPTLRTGNGGLDAN